MLSALSKGETWARLQQLLAYMIAEMRGDAAAG